MSKKILSWDVGIKNLAYCLIEKNEDDFKILDWDIINLVDDRTVCVFKLRTGNCCGKIARHRSFDLLGEEQPTCATHKDKYLPVLKNTDDLECEKCGKQSIKSSSDNEHAWCEKHCEKMSKQYLNKFKPKKFVGQDCNKQSIQTLAHKLYDILDKKKCFMDVDEILIENQPSLKNPTMKTIASLLFSYFIMRGLNDRKTTKSKITNVKFVSPVKKLNINKKETDKNLKDAKNKRDAYAITKELGIIYCKLLIDKSSIEILGKYKKQDDMCDSFLQGFQHLFNPLPKKYVEKLETISDETIEKYTKKKSTKKGKKELKEDDESVEKSSDDTKKLKRANKQK